MSTNDLLGGPLAQAIGLALLHALWQGAVIAGLAAAVLGLLSRRSGSVRYAVACAGLGLVFVVAIGTAARSYTLRDAVSPLPRTALAAPLPDDTVVIAAHDAPASWNERRVAALDLARVHAPQILLLWLAGVLILSMRLAVSWSRARSLTIDGAASSDATWQRIASRLARQLGLRNAVQVLVSSRIDVPSVVGWITPVVLLPVSSFSGLTPEQLEMVLAHELAHVRRHDFVINAMQSVIETLLFYNPAVWWLSRQIRVERENCCDDLAVAVCGDPLAYARALAQLEELRAPALAIAANGGSVIERVRRLVTSRSERTIISSGWTAAVAMTTFVLLLVAATTPTFAARQPKPAVAPPAPSATPAVPATPKPAPAPRARASATRVEVQAPRAAVEQAVAEGVEGAMADVEPFVVDVDVTPEPDDPEDESSTPPGKMSIDDLIALRIQGVTPEYIEQMRSVFPESTVRQVIALKIQDVTPQYVSELRAAGVPIESAREAISLRVQGVNPEFVRQLAAAGYDHLSVRDLVRLAVSGVNADFIREMSKYKK
ncbi:MAG TPA: M56 family metallopeptidase [Thermoanaerobaculia bacterium]|nr:M56 family metallopeptidase [Thermoanaerobaculia bacterium]